MMTMSALEIKIKCKIKGMLVSEKTVNLLKCLQASCSKWWQLLILSGRVDRTSQESPSDFPVGNKVYKLSRGMYGIEGKAPGSGLQMKGSKHKGAVLSKLTLPALSCLHRD